MARKPTGVFCLEGEWDETIESRLTMEPALQLLVDGGYIRLVHRDVATLEELKYYLDKWSKSRRLRYDILYLGFHGSSSTIHLGRDDVTLSDLSTLLSGRCEGKVVHFGACGVLKSSGDVLKSFCRETGARAIVGYTRSVDWIESAAFELLLMERLARSSNMKPVYDSLSSTFPDLTDRLGFRMAHSTWASDRAIAVRATQS